MPTHEDERLLHPLERISNLDTAIPHATCPPDDDESLFTHHSLSSPTRAVAINARARNPPTADSPHPHVEAQSQGVVGGLEVRPASRQASATSSPLADVETSFFRLTTTTASARQYDSNKLKAATTTSDVHGTSKPPPGRTMTPPDAYRITQHTSSFLKHGSRFVGTQQSDRQVYNVTVELKHVDMRESFICGYLCIEGLTDQQRLLTTYFEGEIIGTKYTFQTRHSDWGSNMKVDMQHWNRFPAWRPLARQAQEDNFNYRDYAQREHLFMRWKEHFLVPDHRVTHITGASFEGFYFICFNQIQGTISGIYFHSKSEKFQQLELKHVHDFGCKTAREFA